MGWVVIIAVFILLFVVIAVQNSNENKKWRKARKLDPAKAYYDRADETYNESNEVKSREERFEDAIADLTMAIAIDPEYADAYHTRGALYDEYGKKKEALADYRKYLKLSDYKTESEMFNAFLKHRHLVEKPLADPLVVAKESNKFFRDWVRERVQKLKSLDIEEDWNPKTGKA